MYPYDSLRETYKPKHLRVLMIAESPPPDTSTDSSRHFYRSDKVRKNDRLFTNTMRALYPETASVQEAELEAQKDIWLRRFQTDGWYMIEALETSLPHAVTKSQRQQKIKESLPRLLKRVRKLADNDTKIILVKSNVFEVATTSLRDAGFNVLNTALLDYPGRYNQRAYREKLSDLVAQI